MRRKWGENEFDAVYSQTPNWLLWMRLSWICLKLNTNRWLRIKGSFRLQLTRLKIALMWILFKCDVSSELRSFCDLISMATWQTLLDITNIYWGFLLWVFAPTDMCSDVDTCHPGLFNPLLVFVALRYARHYPHYTSELYLRKTYLWQGLAPQYTWTQPPHCCCYWSINVDLGKL